MNKYELQEVFLKALAHHYNGCNNGYTHGLEIAYSSNGQCQLNLRVGKNYFMCQHGVTFEKALVDLASRWVATVLPMTAIQQLERFLVENK